MTQFRPAEESDRTSIASILDSSFSKIYAYYAKKSFTGFENALVALIDEKVIGVINWRVYAAPGISIGYLFWLAVLPGWRKKGTGTALMKRAMRLIYEKNGPIDIYTAAEKNNKISRKLIEKEGFIIVDKKEVRRQYGRNYSALFGEMMVMPWECLYVKHPA
ncbi:MAG TPA: GNAT family N-acetyltransferase [Chitinivibrionales bacterium]|nr:GNAT family N-acetyltransferase [Chitinivibrionales bacterium]